MTSHDSARALLRKIEQQQRYSVVTPLGFYTGHEVDEDEFCKIIAAALREWEARGLEVVIHKLQEKVGDPDYIDVNRLQLIDWCHAQAQARRERGG